MNIVYKYKLDIAYTGYQELELELPYGATFMKTIEQDGYIFIYANVEPYANLTSRRFCLVWTGCEIETEHCTKFIDTFKYQDLMYHLFEILS